MTAQLSFRRWCVSSWLGVLLLCAGPAWAQNCTATVSDIDFGAPTLAAESHVDAIGSLRIQCTGVTLLSAIKVCPNLGYGSGGGTVSTRTLAGPRGATLPFHLYQDAARTVPWGALHSPQLGSVPPVLLEPGLQGAASVMLPIYARLFLQADAPPGLYASAFSGASATFTYARVLLGQLTGCAGFVGNDVIRPEFTVRASPRPACSVATGDLAFPATGLLSTSVLTQANLWVTCTRGTTYSVSLDNGRNDAGGIGRRMVSGQGASVAYGLFRDPARTVPWGSLEQGQAAAGTGAGVPQAFVVYGRVPPQPTPPPGQYVDRVIVTVTY